jgi:hypothetical protein
VIIPFSIGVIAPCDCSSSGCVARSEGSGATGESLQQPHAQRKHACPRSSNAARSAATHFCEVDDGKVVHVHDQSEASEKRRDAALRPSGRAARHRANAK